MASPDDVGGSEHDSELHKIFADIGYEERSEEW